MSAKNKKQTVNSFEEALKNVKNVANKVNDFALSTTEEIVSESVAVGTQWQGVTAKALNGGLKLAAKQQEITLDTLESVKGQFVKSLNRSKVLFGMN